MAGNITNVNCTALATRSSFPVYIQALRDQSTNNFTLLSVCKPEVCNALWGTGNADISGIGVRLSYSVLLYSQTKQYLDDLRLLIRDLPRLLLRTRS